MLDILYGQRRFSRHHTKRGEKAIESYFKLAKKYGYPPAKFANSFVNDRPFVTNNIIGATSMEQLKENIDSVNLILSNEILDEINDIHFNRSKSLRLKFLDFYLIK